MPASCLVARVPNIASVAYSDLACWCVHPLALLSCQACAVWHGASECMLCGMIQCVQCLVYMWHDAAFAVFLMGHDVIEAVLCGMMLLRKFCVA